MKWIISLLLTVLVAGCGGVRETQPETKPSNFGTREFPSESGTIYGAWETVSVTNKPDYRLFFNRNGQYGMEMVCSTGGGAIRASALGTVKVEPSQVTFMTGVHGKGVDDKGNEACSFMSGAYSSIYSLINETLTLSAADGTGARSFKRLW